MFKKYNNIINNADSINCLSGNGYNYNKSKYKNSIVSVNVKNNFGYNLIILSVIILIMGALMTATISYYDINNINRRTKNTQDKFKVIHTALISYLAKNGKFPCPAPLDCDSTGCTNEYDYNGSTIEGDDNKVKALGKEFRDKQEGSKNCIADNSGVFESKNSYNKKLLYGNVPAISLGLDNSYLVDDWGNKIVYIIPDAITKDNALKDILYNKNSEDGDDEKLKKYVVYDKDDKDYKNGEVFLLLSNNKNTSGAFPFESRISNSFNEKITSTTTNEDGTTTTTEEIIYNLPKNNFKVDISDPNYLKYYKNVDSLHEAFSGGRGEISEPDCKKIDLNYDIYVENRECHDYVFAYDVVYDENGKETKKGKPQEFTIPNNAKQLKIEVWGAGGGHTIARKDDINNYNSRGGKGGYSYGILEINEENLKKLNIVNRKLYLYVGEKGHNSPAVMQGTYDDEGQLILSGDGYGGWNGGGSGFSRSETIYFFEGGGGGASDIRTVGGNWNNAASLESRIIIAGGGGGASRVNEGRREERGGDGAGGIGETKKGYERHKFGGNASGQDANQMPGLGGGQTATNSNGKKVTCSVKGGGTLKGGGGYFAGGSTFCRTKKYNDRFIASCDVAQTSYSYANECGGGGGGSSFIHSAFSVAGGQSGVRRSDGKIRICVISEKNNTDNNNTDNNNTDSNNTKNNSTFSITFPEAKYGELSFPSDFVCPYFVTTPETKIDDYYTLSNFKDKNNLIINNKPAIKCGKNGEWETNEDGSIKMIYECLELQKCEQPFAFNSEIDWGDFDFEVVNTGKVENVGGTKKMQCIVDKDNNASWHIIQ